LSVRCRSRLRRYGTHALKCRFTQAVRPLRADEHPHPVVGGMEHSGDAVSVVTLLTPRQWDHRNGPLGHRDGESQIRSYA
jgi:hypothetical protein